MSGARFGLSNFLVLAVLLVIALGLVFLLRQPNDGSGTPSPSGANPASPGSPVPSLTPQQTTIAQETATPQETGTPWYVELSPAVSNEQTHEAAGDEPTPNATQLAEMEEAYLGDSLFTRQGRVIAEGTNQTPTAGGLTTYRIEEVIMTGTISLTWTVPHLPGHSWDTRRVTFVAMVGSAA